MRMTYLYHDAEGRAVVALDQNLLEVLTAQNSASIMKPHEDLRLHEHVTKFRETYFKYREIKEHFSKFFAALMNS